MLVSNQMRKKKDNTYIDLILKLDCDSKGSVATPFYKVQHRERSRNPMMHGKYIVILHGLCALFAIVEASPSI